jgi:cardiolipin hydrolase
MDDSEVKEQLRLSLEDGQLSRAERDVFRQYLEESAVDGQRRALYQSMAFDLAREALERNTVPLHSALNWLEKVVKLITPLAQSASTPSTAEACFSPQHDCAGRIVRLFDSARASADVCVFTITDDRIADAMMRARKRGVTIRVITDDDKQFDPGSDVRRLDHSGIEVRLDNTEHHMHHKFAIFDGALLLTGSYNWTRSAALHNEENFLLTSDPKLSRPFSQLFEELWRNYGKGH